jgi:hypothetical protein
MEFECFDTAITGSSFGEQLESDAAVAVHEKERLNAKLQQPLV